MRLVYTILIVCCFSACKSHSEDKEKNKQKTDTEYSNKAQQPETNDTNEVDVYDDEKPVVDTQEDKTSSLAPEGTYRNTSNTDAAANCDSIEISYSRPTDLCVDAEGITIKVRYAKVNGQTEMYYSSLVNNNTDKEVPFDTFETTTPIAIIIANSNETLTLDWKGFSVNGDIATNYAILGKKNLEGTFEK